MSKLKYIFGGLFACMAMLAATVLPASLAGATYSGGSYTSNYYFTSQVGSDYHCAWQAIGTGFGQYGNPDVHGYTGAFHLGYCLGAYSLPADTIEVTAQIQVFFANQWITITDPSAQTVNWNYYGGAQTDTLVSASTGYWGHTEDCYRGVTGGQVLLDGTWRPYLAISPTFGTC